MPVNDHRRMDRVRREWTNLRRPTSPRHATAAEAVRYLASVCDGATRRDGHGFSSDHVAYGHWLAALPADRWTPAEHAGARQLVRIYRNQLARVVFAPADILTGRRPRRISRRVASRLQAGWAPDPCGLHEWRWWNGLRWTEHVAGWSQVPQRSSQLLGQLGPQVVTAAPAEQRANGSAESIGDAGCLVEAQHPGVPISE